MSRSQLGVRLGVMAWTAARVSALTMIVVGMGAMLSPVQAGPGAAGECPPYGFRDSANLPTNLAQNPSFEVAGQKGTANCPYPCLAPSDDPSKFRESAAANWRISTDNMKSAVFTRLVPTTVPHGTDPPHGQRMLRIRAKGGEGGVVQHLQNPPKFMMVSVWVYVRSGFVLLQPHGGAGPVSSWSTKKNQWEQLRVCTDGTVGTDDIVIVNQDPNGGDFDIDRAEARHMPDQKPCPTC